MRAHHLRSPRKSAWLTASALAGLLLVVGACANDGQQDLATSGASAGPAQDEVVIVIAAEPDTLNPVLGYARWGDGKVVEGLTALDEHLESVPALAQELPEISDDGLTYTFTLRSDVLFHDGSTLDAHDVVATYEAAIDPALNSPAAADLTALATVQAVDESTVRFELAHPHSSFLTATALGIVPAESLEAVREGGEALVPAGTGPYTVQSWRPGEQLVLSAFEDYWGPAPEVSRATFLFAADDSARAARLAAGEVHGAMLPPQALARFEDDPAFEVVRRDTADYRAVVMPEAHPVTSDLAIRQALHHGLDREALVEGALAGGGRAAYSPLPPEAADYVPVLEVDHDVRAAEDVLDEAGWIVGPDGVRARDGERAHFALMYPAGDMVRQNIALQVQAQAQELGIQITPEGLSWDAIESRMSTDALVYGSGNPYSSDLSTYPLFHSSRAGQGFDNPGHYVSSEMDAALEAGRAAVDVTERQEAYVRVQEQLAQDLPWIFLAYVEHDYVIQSGVWQGYDVNLVEPHEHGLQGGPWWNLPAWTSTTD